MYKVLKAKFTQNPMLGLYLRETANHLLEEGNYWHDNYWGVCYCQQCKNIEGYNGLGKTLMKLRDELCRTL